jgi:hypothetical protein
LPSSSGLPVSPLIGPAKLLLCPTCCSKWLDFSARAAYSSPWWWRQKVYLKRRQVSTRLYNSLSQKTAIFTLILIGVYL